MFERGLSPPPPGTETFFLWGSRQTGRSTVVIEAKATERVTRDHLRGLRSLALDHPGVGHRIVVCREPRARRTDDGIEILPYASFVRRLWAGELTCGRPGSRPRPRENFLRSRMAGTPCGAHAGCWAQPG